MPDTDWIDVRAAGDPSTPEGREALGRIMGRYRQPLLGHLTGKYRFTHDEANDLLQSFVQDKIIVNGMLRRADPHRGQLRSLLVNALDRFVLTYLRRRRSRKHHPAGALIPLHEVTDDELPRHHDIPAGDTELVWARAVIAGALLDMHAELTRRGRLQIWSIFEQRILLPMLDDQPVPRYTELVQRFQFPSPTKAFNALVTAKRMFQRHLTSVVAEYATNDREIANELTSLRSILQAALPSSTRARRTTSRRKAQRKNTKPPTEDKKAKPRDDG